MWILPIRKCAESVPKICVSAFFLQKARAETRNDRAGQKYTFTQKTNRKLKLKRTHSWFLHWQKRLVLSVVSSSRNRTFTNRSVLMPRFYTCETANPAISHVPYTWHAVRCILSAHCVPQRVFCSKSIQLKILNKFNSKSLFLMKILNILLHFNLQKHRIYSRKCRMIEITQW